MIVVRPQIMDEKYSNIIEIAKDRVGDSFRTASVLHGENVELLYHRDDLDRALMQKRGEHVADVAQNRDPFVRSNSISECLADIELYEEYVLTYWHSENLLLTFEPVVAQRLRGFVEECNLALQGVEQSRYY